MNGNVSLETVSAYSILKNSVPQNVNNTAYTIKKSKKNKKTKLSKTEIKSSPVASRRKVKTSNAHKVKRLTNVGKKHNSGTATKKVYSLLSNRNGEVETVSKKTGTDSSAEGKKLLQWIISPLDVDRFMRTHWEQQHVHLTRNNASYFSSLISTTEIDKVLQENHLYYYKHINIAKYENGQRLTLGHEARALAHEVWEFYRDKCSVQFINPHHFVPSIHKLLAGMQEYFECLVSANIYLTPPNSQGFAPHYDDIEAFILQIEGRKHWKIYKPKPDSLLPRVSSPDFKESEIGYPDFEITLEAGDVLYFPRGYIHQALTDSEQHSLHLTVSTYQKNTWADLLEQAIPNAITEASEVNVEFRKGLPINYLNCAGTIYDTKLESTRERVSKTIKSLMHKLVDFVDIDKVMDKMGLKFAEDALPPFLNSEDRMLSVFGSKLKMNAKGLPAEVGALDDDTQVKLIRKHVIRLVNDGKEYKLYYTLENSLNYHGEETQMLIVTPSWLPIIELLISSYPEFVKISDLPEPLLSEEEEQIDLLDMMTVFWDRGILVTSKPLSK